jgi:hypothetical protein
MPLINSRTVFIAAASSLGLLSAVAVMAQSPPPAQQTSPPEIMDPPIESTTPPPDPSTGGSDPKEPLSEKLDQNEGVLEPPRGIDPEIRKPIPEDFKAKTPVIPPPGEPGGNENVQPK